MSEYYYLTSSMDLDSSGSFIDIWMTGSSEDECIECGPITSSIEGEYILKDGYKEILERNLHKGTISLYEEERLRVILYTQRYVEGDRAFIQYCADKLIG